MNSARVEVIRNEEQLPFSDFPKENFKFQSENRFSKNNEKINFGDENLKSKNEIGNMGNVIYFNYNQENLNGLFNVIDHTPCGKPTSNSKAEGMFSTPYKTNSFMDSTPKINTENLYFKKSPLLDSSGMTGLAYHESNSCFKKTPRNYLDSGSNNNNHNHNHTSFLTQLENSDKLGNNNFEDLNNINSQGEGHARLKHANSNSEKKVKFIPSDDEECEHLKEEDEVFTDMENFGSSNLNSNLPNLPNLQNLPNSRNLLNKESVYKANNIKLCCTCTKTMCQKKYCKCFDNNQFCNNCECKNCQNRPKKKDKLKKQNDPPFNMTQNKSEVICNCLRSNCSKNYCECYKAGERCKESCRCVNCDNIEKNGLKINYKKLNDAEIEKIQVARNPLNFIIEGTSIEIINEKIFITDWKRTTNEMKIAPKTSEKPDPQNPFRNNLKNVFHVKNIKYSENFQELNDTPLVNNKKRRRTISSKLNSTEPPTPLNMTTASDKGSSFKSIKFDDEKIVKNLDKIYNQ